MTTATTNRTASPLRRPVRDVARASAACRRSAAPVRAARPAHRHRRRQRRRQVHAGQVPRRACTPGRGRGPVDGAPVHFTTPSSRSAGIETVFQDLALVEDLTVAQNLFLGREETRGSARSSRPPPDAPRGARHGQQARDQRAAGQRAGTPPVAASARPWRSPGPPASQPIVLRRAHRGARRAGDRPGRGAHASEGPGHDDPADQPQLRAGAASPTSVQSCGPGAWPRRTAETAAERSSRWSPAPRRRVMKLGVHALVWSGTGATRRAPRSPRPRPPAST